MLDVGLCFYVFRFLYLRFYSYLYELFDSLLLRVSPPFYVVVILGVLGFWCLRWFYVAGLDSRFFYVKIFNFTKVHCVGTGTHIPIYADV